MGLQFDIIVLGDYFYDLIYSGLKEFPALGREVVSTDVTTSGGAMYITAVSMHRLGIRVGWPAYFGNDYYSQSVYTFAQNERLDLPLACFVDRPYRRVTTALPLHGERAFVTYTDPQADDLYEHWLRSMECCEFRHVHVGGYDCFDRLKPILELARSRQATISLDCQDGPHLENPRRIRESIGAVDVFMPNAREARIVAETDDTREAVRRLTQYVETIVVKDGANGAWAGQGDTVLQSPAIEAGPVVDTTGAGDCFNAGFLYGYVVEGAPLDRCLRYGNVCGGLSVTGAGGATTAPTRTELDLWMAQLLTA